MKNNSRVYYTGKILFYLFLVLILGNLFYNCSNEDGESVPTIQESLGNGGKEKYTYVYQLNTDNYNMPIEGSISPEYDDSPEGKNIGNLVDGDWTSSFYTPNKSVSIIWKGKEPVKRLCEPCKEHVGNNFNPMPKVYLREFLPIRTRIFNLMVEIRRMMEQNDYSDIENVLIEAEGLRESISTERKTQMYRVQEEGNSLHVSLVYLITLQESQELVDTLRQLLKACNKFTK